MRRFALAIGGLGACALVSACSGYSFPGGLSTGTGTVTGQVLAVPCAPVEKVGSPCQGRPVAGAEIVFTSETAHVDVVTKTDSSGNYSVSLAAGTWEVSVRPVMRVISGPKTVVVEPEKTVIANYLVDSGIRVPAAAGTASP